MTLRKVTNSELVEMESQLSTKPTIALSRLFTALHNPELDTSPKVTERDFAKIEYEFNNIRCPTLPSTINKLCNAYAQENMKLAQAIIILGDENDEVTGKSFETTNEREGDMRETMWNRLSTDKVKGYAREVLINIKQIKAYRQELERKIEEKIVQESNEGDGAKVDEKVELSTERSAKEEAREKDEEEVKVKVEIKTEMEECSMC